MTIILQRIMLIDDDDDDIEEDDDDVEEDDDGDEEEDDDADVDSLLTFKRKCGVDLLAGRQTQAGNCQGLKLEIASVHNWKLSRFKIGAKSF